MRKWQIKSLLASLAAIMIMSVILYTQQLVNELVEREKRTVEFYAGIYKYYLSKPDVDPENFIFLIYNVTPTIPFPIILADEKGNPSLPLSEYSLNVEFDTTQTEERQIENVKSIMSEMKREYTPIDIKDQDGKIIQRIYYSNSSLIRRVYVLPYVEIAIVAAFVAVGYIAFSVVKRNEESRIWVGMAKEAAHQLGTPLSSLLAWIEIMDINKENPSSIGETLEEMKQDIDRLNIIATRFSKIGSAPKKELANIGEEIEKVCRYFERRVPHIGKKIEIRRTVAANIYASVNTELFEWVLENLLKNAVQAIEAKDGVVEIRLYSIVRDIVTIVVMDDGKGMTKQVRRQVFDPGFTTKKRGWGLGLSLSKRIIEEYHSGKIFVKETSPGKGTVFQLEIPADSAENY